MSQFPLKNLENRNVSTNWHFSDETIDSIRELSDVLSSIHKRVHNEQKLPENNAIIKIQHGKNST